MLCRFDAFRKEQEQMANDVLDAITNKCQILCHAPTGIGKTDAAVSAALTYAADHDATIFFVTPKNSQHKIVIDVINGINKKYRTDFVAVDIVGKPNLCTNENLYKLDPSSFYHVCEDYCTKNACEYYANTMNQSIWAQKARELGNKIFTNIDASDYTLICQDIGVCGYEATMRMIKTANAIIADYNHIFYPEIFSYVAGKGMKRPDNSILIVDEAHNLAQRLTAKLSKTLSIKRIKRAYKEAKKRNFPIKKDIKEFYFSYKEALKQALGKQEEVLLDQHFLDFFNEKERFANELLFYGQKVILETRRMSNMSLLGAFVQEWDTEGSYTRIGQKQNKRIIKHCLDARTLSGVINNFHSAVLMSGTLKPLEMHEQLLGLKNCIKKEYKNPFPKENILALHVPGYTSKFSRRGEVTYKNLAEKIIKISNEVQGKIVVYLPSFAVIQGVTKALNQIDYGKKAMLIQTEKMKNSEVKALLNNFEKLGDVLFCVLGGSFAEGIEFKNNVVKCVIIAGLPLEKRGLIVNERIKYFENEFGNGEFYGYDAPAMIKVVQACGRLIRNERDYGAVIFLEDRIAWQKYKKFLPESLEFIQTTYPEIMLKTFFEQQRKEIEYQRQPTEKKS